MLRGSNCQLEPLNNLPKRRNRGWVASVSSGMSTKRLSQPGLIDAFVAGLGGPRTTELLTRLDAAIDWDRLAAPIAALPEYKKNGPGRPAWPPVVMLRCLMLAKWFNLSDPGLEEALLDRLSFRTFVGLSRADGTPDETTFVRFRARLRDAGLHEAIFHGVVEQIAERGLLVREGTMVDATIIEQSRGRGEQSRGRGGARVEDDAKNKGDTGQRTTTRDPDASFTRKHGRSYFGYKGHAAADLSGIVTGYRFSPAGEHDGRYLDELCADETRAVYADALYDSGPRRASFEARGVAAHIAHQRRRGQEKLHPWQAGANAVVARTRCKIEHAFARLKARLGWRRVRYRGLERNAFDFAMLLAAANLMHSLSLRPEAA